MSNYLAITISYVRNYNYVVWQKTKLTLNLVYIYVAIATIHFYMSIKILASCSYVYVTMVASSHLTGLHSTL